MTCASQIMFTASFPYGLFYAEAPLRSFLKEGSSSMTVSWLKPGPLLCKLVLSLKTFFYPFQFNCRSFGCHLGSGALG